MQKYNSPPSTASSIGSQLNSHHYARAALIEAAKEQYFLPLADVVSMPKHYGKKIKRYVYIPLLDDANVNDQGIDAQGQTSGGKNDHGNLYGSSKDVGTISGKLPALSETGGRVNRVGFKRKEIEGTFEKFGFFYEYTQASLDFDTDKELNMHVHREALRGANEITEDALQIDLLNSAGTVRYAGAATSKDTIADTHVVTYKDLMNLSIALDNNRTPKRIKMIKGSTLNDTRTIPASRVAYIGSELIPIFRAMKDLHNNPAFIPVEKYAAAGETLQGEIGSVDSFRLVVVPEMMKWAGGGASTSDPATYETGGKVDVFPILVVGEESFTAIGFNTDGKSQKFKITHKKPGQETADRNDPYGEIGFASIKWFYGFMPLRPERLAVFHTAAKM